MHSSGYDKPVFLWWIVLSKQIVHDSSMNNNGYFIMMLLLVLDIIMQNYSTVTVIQLQFTEKFKGCKFSREKLFSHFSYFFLYLQQLSV